MPRSRLIGGCIGGVWVEWNIHLLVWHSYRLSSTSVQKALFSVCWIEVGGEGGDLAVGGGVYLADPGAHQQVHG